MKWQIIHDNGHGGKRMPVRMRGADSPLTQYTPGYMNAIVALITSIIEKTPYGPPLLHLISNSIWHFTQCNIFMLNFVLHRSFVNEDCYLNPTLPPPKLNLAQVINHRNRNQRCVNTSQTK